jgi:diacylglycerol O-acyltransferase / wax synthase
MEHMSPLDAMFLHVEDGVTHMHIGSCAVFEGPAPAYDELVALVASKLPLLVRYRQKVRFVPGGLGRPVWVDDPHFNLLYHVRHSALPPPGSERELNALMGRLMSQELDRHRPLWETWMIEGLPRGRWAIISKVHHCMVDGISGTDLMALLLDPTPEPLPAVPDHWTPTPEPSDSALVVDALEQLAANPYEQLRAARAATRAPRRAIGYSIEALRGLFALGRELLPGPPLSLHGGIGPHRRWAAARTTLGEIKVIRAALGGTVNDVVLCVITGAFRQLLLSRADAVDQTVLRSLVPVSVRAVDDRTANNQVSAMIAELPIGAADPLERLAAVRRQMADLKESHQAVAGEALTSLAGFAAPNLLALGLRAASATAQRFPQRSVHTVTTNVPGPQRPLYAAGREMIEYLPFVPLGQGVRIGVAILSYNGRVSFGVTGDFDTVPEVEDFCRAIETGITELLELARATAGGEAAPPKKRAAKQPKAARSAPRR